MGKKKSSKQTIVIIILCILLLISIVFGFTYSYYNGRSNLVTGKIITANLSIELQNGSGQTGECLISAPLGEEYLVCGNNLNNIELNILNKSNEDTYIVVVYALTANKIDTGEDVTPNNTPALDFQTGAFDTNVWTQITYQCENIDRSYTCLVGKQEFEGKGSTNGNLINILRPNKVSVPRDWDNTLQNCNITISVIAYAIQSKGLDDDGGKFYQDLGNAQDNNNYELAANIIAKKVLQTCLVDA